MFTEALLLHLWIGLVLKIVPFRWIPRLFAGRQFENPTKEEDQSSKPNAGPAVSGRQSEILPLMKDAISRAGKVSPWRNRCLVSSLAGRCMLNRRNIISQIFFGAAKTETGSISAHAWLRSGDIEVVSQGREFVELSSF